MIVVHCYDDVLYQVKVFLRRVVASECESRRKREEEKEREMQPIVLVG